MGKLDHQRAGERLAARESAARQPASSAVSTPGGRRASRSPQPPERTRGPRGAVLVLPVKESWSATAPEPVGLDPTPAVSGALALLESPAPAPDASVRAIPARHQILIVEDDPHTARVLRNALELEGEPDWGVEVASEGMRALELVARTPPDVVLLDVRLPDLDGGEVYRRLRAGHQTGRARVLFITAFTSLDLYQRGIEDGVLLRKPFDVEELVGLVRALLAE